MSDEKKEETEQIDSERDLEGENKELIEAQNEETTTDNSEIEQEKQIKFQDERLEEPKEPLTDEILGGEEETEQGLASVDVPIEDEEEEEEKSISETTEITEELSIPEIPSEQTLETEEKEEAPFEEEVPESEIESISTEELKVEESGFEVKKLKPRRKKKKKGLPFALSILIGLGVALLLEVLFSIPLWVGGVGRPDLFYIELVLILVAMTIPGLFTRSIQKGILGAFLIFIVAFALPFVLTLLGLRVILSPLTPLFSSTDFSLDAFNVFKSLFPNLSELPIEQIQRWIWIVDLVLMFLLTLFVVLTSTALIKNITKKKKKTGTWVAIPFLSIGLIIFAVFTPIIFSASYGIIQASSSFLAGTAKMQQAFGVFESSGSTPSTQAMEWIENNLTEAYYWFNITQTNYKGLENIGVINLAVVFSGRYGPLIEAGDQLALATLAMTGMLLPLFTGIYEVTQSLRNATDDMANFGSSSSSSATKIISEVSKVSLKNMEQTDALKESIIKAIQGLERAGDALSLIQQKIDQQDIQGSFDEVKAKMDSINIESLPTQVKNIILEIRSRLDQFDGQLEGFTNFISYTMTNLEPTKKILWGAYNTLVGNEYLKLRQFKNATLAFMAAYNNISEISEIATYTSTGNMTGFFALEMTEKFTLMLNDLVQVMEPLLLEQIAFAQTYDNITEIMRIFAAAPDISFINYSSIHAPITLGIETEVYGGEAQIALDNFKANIQATAYGPMFNRIGANFDKILTDDFRPQAFGNTTRIMTEIMDHYLMSCESYSNQLFTNASGNITTAELMMTNDLLPLIITEDPQYLQDYYNNWSLALGDLKTKMELYDTPAEYSTGLTEIQTTILELYAQIEEK